jgi:hypothetical protein
MEFGWNRIFLLRSMAAQGLVDAVTIDELLK